MNGVCGCLVLTMETEEMFPSGKLPTLNLEIWVRSDNKVLCQYYEKPMVPNMVLNRRSSMPEGTMRATLNQELTGRMVNTSEMVEVENRIEIVDNYAQKLINSEYSPEQTIVTIVAGLKVYKRFLSPSLDEENPRWKPLHLSARLIAKNKRVAK